MKENTTESQKMKKQILLHLGAEGGEVTLTSTMVNDTRTYQVNVSEIFDVDDKSNSFSTQALAWKYLQKQYKSWQMLYPLAISAEIRPLVQKAFDFNNSNENVQNYWKYHLSLCPFTLKSMPDIVDYINNNSDAIINKLEHESFETYLFITENYKSNITENYLFQFVFRSYYRLDGGGLSPEIKRTFFELFEQYKQVDLSHYWSQPLSEIVERLYQIPSLKSQNTVQFSFATKLLNTLNNRIPIYDSEVKMVFGFADAYSTDYKKRVERLLSYHQVISDTYSIINRDNLLGLTLDKLDSKFPMYTHIPEIKKLDFVFWAAGKLMRSTSKN